MEKQIVFENPYGEKLSGFLHLPDRPSGRGVVMGHCFTCSKHTGILRRMARDLAKAGCIALRFDFSGNGQSEGRFSDSTYSKQIAEMQKAMAVVAAEGADWIGLAGHSMGASIAILTASRTETVGAVAALAGRLSGTDPSRFLTGGQLEDIRDTGRAAFSSRGRRLEITRDFFADADRFDLPGAVASLGVPLLVVHGDADGIVPVAEAYRARDFNPKHTELFIVPGADHMFSDDNHGRQASTAVVGWFAGRE